MSRRSTAQNEDDSTSDRRCVPMAARGQVVAAPRGRLVRRSLETMNGWVIAGRYRVTQTLGTGGMGSVYEAVDVETGKEVALKALHPGAYDTARLKRFRREATIAMRVRSEYVSRVHYLGVDRGTPFIVMDRLYGETVQRRLTTHGPFSVREAVSIMCQLLDALTAAHEAGVIHRDVKPGNVFLCSAPGEPPRVKLIDFGLAKPLQAEEHDEDAPDLSDITPADGLPGTLGFLAPEQILGYGAVDQRVDVYMAGLTFFALLTGRRPHESAAREDVLGAILLGEPPRARAWRPELPEVFDDVLAMATAKARDRRFASAEAFKRALLAALRESRALVESGICPAFNSAPSTRRDSIVVELDDECPTLRPPPRVRDTSADTIPMLAPLPWDLRVDNDD